MTSGEKWTARVTLAHQKIYLSKIATCPKYLKMPCAGQGFPSCGYSEELELLAAVARGLMARLHFYKRSFAFLDGKSATASASGVGSVAAPPPCLSDPTFSKIIKNAERKFPATDWLVPAEQKRPIQVCS